MAWIIVSNEVVVRRVYKGEMRMRTARYTKGFTLVELLVGMLITSIVLSAVATFAFALSVATNAGDDTAVKQVQLRQATLRIRDLVATCQLLCAAPGNDLVIWKDDNNDHRINLNELVYVERGDSCNLLRLCRFSAPDNPVETLDYLAQAPTKSQFLANYGATYTSLIPVCRDVQFAFYPASSPVTQAQCLMISFVLTENGGDHPYEIVAALQSRAGYLLNSAGTALATSDDD